MTNNTDSITLTKALNFLRHGLKQGVWKQGHRLPGYRTLAHDAGVGHKTMLKALGLVKKEKLVMYRERLGIYAGTTIPQKPVTPVRQAKTLKWKNIEEQLKIDLLQGDFHDSLFLPSSKELTQRYNVDYRTMQKAIDALINEQLIYSDKNRLRTNVITSARTSRVICLILSDTYFDGNCYYTDKLNVDEFTRSTEKECSQKKLRLIKCRCTMNFKAPVDSGQIAGFMVWHTPDLNLSTRDLIHRLRMYEKPVAIFFYAQAQTEDLVSLIDYCSRNTNFFLSSPNLERSAGNIMGRFLWNKGYKKLFFFTKDATSHTTAERLAGLQESFIKLNMPKAVTALVYNELMKTEPGLFTGHTQTENPDISAELAFIEETQHLAEKQLSSLYAKQLSFQLKEIRYARDSCSFYTPLFKKALAESSSAAWVCVDDHTALYGAMEFLAHTNIKIPGQIAIAGFDDLPESSIHNLTSYHFDITGAARKMINLIMFPEYAKKTLCVKGSNIFEVDGMVIDRGSA